MQASPLKRAPFRVHAGSEVFSPGWFPGEGAISDLFEGSRDETFRADYAGRPVEADTTITPGSPLVARRPQSGLPHNQHREEPYWRQAWRGMIVAWLAHD